MPQITEMELDERVRKLKTELSRPIKNNVNILELMEGQEQDTIVSGVLRTYIKRRGKVFYIEWTAL